MAASNCTICDVAIVGSGFAGALIAKELSEKGIKVVILEAGEGIQPNINDYMKRFYKADAKVPESAHPPELQNPDGGLRDPGKVAAGRPTVLTLSASNWKDPKQSYLIQKGPQPFASTYERLAGGTSHWLGTSLRLVPADFRMQTKYGTKVPNFPFPDWPKDIDTQKLSPWYDRAEAELGVSADKAEQSFLGIGFSKPDYKYPMPRIPGSVLDQRMAEALAKLTDEETRFLGMEKPVTGIKVRSLPAARNSQPYRNRRACAGNTNCIPICPIQAKYDPTISLNDATNNGAKLLDHAVASEVIVENGRVSQINYITYENEAGPRTGEGCVKARIYVIAANAIETPRLLLMSKNGGATINGVANSSGMVGRHLMDHPYYVAWALMPAGKPVFPYRGPLITSGIGDLCDGPFRAKRAGFRVDIGNEGWNFVVAGAQFGADPHVTTVDFVNGMNSSGINTKEFNQLGKDNAALFGADLANKLNDLVTRQFRIGFLVEQPPDPNNRVTLSTEYTDALGLPRPEITYSISDYTKQGIVAAYRLRKLIFDKMGATDFTHRRNDPLNDNPAGFVEIIDGEPVQLSYGGAGHIMGTYRMGDDSRTSVVDSNQRSHDHSNLYLVGSGTFPTGATANPTLTLSALALRSADSIAGDLKSRG
jgi:glucose dehydrogenase